jgi:hypothetical protein
MDNLIQERQKDISSKYLIAKSYFSGFDEAHDTYNAISAASDGKVYYVLSSNTLKSGKFYRFDPLLDQTEFIADLNDMCGEANACAIPQGKSHSRLFEMSGKLFIATHVGFYEMIEGFERLPVNLPDGYKPYPGGHLLSYDLITGELTDLMKVPFGEGIVTMTMDTKRGQIYGITWPSGHFIHYDSINNKFKDLGLVSGQGEAGIPGEDYRVICRSMFIDPRDGSVYYSTSEGDIFSYHFEENEKKKIDAISLKLDYLGRYDYTRPGSMSYNWRKIFWYEPEDVAYGVHGNSGYLFRFDPKKSTIEIVERLTSDPSRKSGMFDQFTYGYLGFILGPDKETIYYLTGGPIFEDGKLIRGDDQINVGSKGIENVHLITYNIPSGEYIDHGPICYSDGSIPGYVNSIAMTEDGTIYTLARFEHEGKVIEDLVKIANPLTIN